MMWLALVASPWPATASAAAAVTREQVVALVDTVTTAVRRHDADTVLASFTPDAKITVVAPARLGGTRRLALSEYRAMLIGGWRQLPDSAYEVSDIVIELAEGGRSATVTSTVREAVDAYGKSLSSTTQQRMTVVARAGKPKIAFLHAVFRVKGL
ncbi:MAG TPA: hypothetical protein DDZ67_04655 [Xanthomonadaceae bacterium]|nr:hypothetical protein [Xanthomonadaceae bacterium]